MHSRSVLVIGGGGYIGSHVCKALKNRGYLPVTFDNLSNGHEWAVKWGPLVRGDLHRVEDLEGAFEKYSPLAVIHLVSSINVRESIQRPELYYQNNLLGTFTLAKVMSRHNVDTLVFSSSAAVYGTPEYTPINEEHPKHPLNPYGRTKWMAEQMLEDFHHAYGLNTLSLRYFNAAGADPDGEVGEAHHPETHLIPQVIFTAQGMRPHVTIYGDDFPTPDGTAIRDYIHVSDLALAHCLGVDWLLDNHRPLALNLGTGKGHSIREIITAIERQAQTRIAVEVQKRSAFESPILIADAAKARNYLGWNSSHSHLETIIETAWNWHLSPVTT